MMMKMKQSITTLTSLIALLTATSLQAQENAGPTEPTKTEALMRVSVVDGQQQPLEGETIIFANQSNGKKIECTTNTEGKCNMLLPEGYTYNAILVSFTGQKDEQLLEIPKHPQAVAYDYQLQKLKPVFKTITLENVEFETNSAQITRESYPYLDDLAEYLEFDDQLKVEISGHTDNVGNDEYNMKLSQQRANSIRKYLIGKGIAASRIMAKGYGENKPIADNQTEEGRAKNRRIEVHVIE
jgi:outer membrane protein OmpA-like peptidoglycan-associated protein